MHTPMDSLDLAIIGERLRVVREAAKVTQANAAAAAGIARTTLVAIEQGQRRVRIDELQQLAKFYGVSVNALVRQEAIFADLVPRFRKLPGSAETAIDHAARVLNDLVRAEVELENLLGVQRPRNYPSQRPILPGDIRAQAEQDAGELRQWLGLGLGPVTDIFTLLELQLGVRVYVRRLPQKVSGLFAYDEAVGACMLLNANHSRSRRSQTAAHELGHLISTRNEPDVLSDDTTEQSREERYANAFARGFLTPARAVLQRFEEITAGASRLSRRHVIVLAHAFGVSREAIVRRLEELGRAKPGTWDWFSANGGITDEQERQVLGDLVAVDSHKMDAEHVTSLRLGILAGEAWRQGLMSEGQLARLLRLERIEVRALFDGLDVEGSGDNEPTTLP
jgi:Zn-dependent peptidase ImmA (M78 family)